MSTNKLNQHSSNKNPSPTSALTINSLNNHHLNSELTINNSSSNQLSKLTAIQTSPKSDLLKPKDDIQSSTENKNLMKKIKMELNFNETNDESNVNNDQSIQNQDVRPNENSEANKNETTKKDSPAFRLRTRRSTPRKLNSIYSSPYTTSRNSRRFTLFSPNNSNQLQIKVAKLKSNLNDVKINLFGNSNDLNNCDLNKIDQQFENESKHSPSKSLVEDIDLNVFAENILVDKLTIDTGKNNLNYLSLRVIEVLNEEEIDENSNKFLKDFSITNNQSPNKCSSSNDLNGKCSSILNNLTTLTKKRLLKLYCQQAETKSILNVQKPVVLLYLFNEYVNFKDRLQPGSILEIVKFEIKKLPSNQLTKYKQNLNEVDIYPFYVELNADRSNSWIPLISIKKKFEPTNSNLLNVINTQNKFQTHETRDDQPPTKNPILFSSYVVKSESTEQNNKLNLQNTKSPTIKRFMKTISKSYTQQDNGSKLKIKK